ncbi:8457_t:CDS:10 [Funneliformis caledonium]|uniref:8457_t:CDS:1 n=1 Tax=Funneliformis caledonium TaxID=1117310 RepID=A0A9N8V354_9GLOM|nr:8457_t:CDS:10 [Funneliformis caledonium]
MSETELSQDPAKLQALVRQQAKELKKIKQLNADLTEKSEGLSDRTKALQQVEQSEKSITKSLQEQLNYARQEKATLEASMEARAKSFQSTLSKLQINQGHSIVSEIGAGMLPSPIPTDAQKLAMESEDPIVLKQELQNAYERIRQQELEIKKLKFEVEMEQGHVNILRHDNQMLRQITVDMHASAEQEEEYISNKLLKRISGLKKEKGELLLQVEQEEEYLTNTLQKKLNQLQKEKIDMENALEQEQEYIVNRLQKQLDSLRQQQTYHPHHSRENSTSSTSNTGSITPLPPASPSSTHKKWITAHSSSPTSPDFSLASPGIVEVLKVEVGTLRTRISEIEKEYIAKSSQATRFKNELIELRKKSGLPVEDLLSEEPVPAFIRHSSNQRNARRSNSNTHNPNNSTQNLVRGRSVSAGDVKSMPLNVIGLGPQSISTQASRSRSVSATLNQAPTIGNPNKSEPSSASQGSPSQN